MSGSNSNNIVALDDTNRFKTFPMTEYEVIGASKLSELQKQGIRNTIAGYAHELISLQYDETKPHTAEYLRNYCRGAIEALEHLLHTDEEVRNAEQELTTTANGNIEE